MSKFEWTTADKGVLSDHIREDAEIALKTQWIVDPRYLLLIAEALERREEMIMRLQHENARLKAKMHAVPWWRENDAPWWRHLFRGSS